MPSSLFLGFLLGDNCTVFLRNQGICELKQTGKTLGRPKRIETPEVNHENLIKSEAFFVLFHDIWKVPLF